MARQFKPAPEHLQGIIRTAAENNGMTYEELERQLWIESDYNPTAQGPVLKDGTRAQGIAQFVPATAKEWGVDVNDVTSSINGAARYMAWLTKQFGGDKRAARAAYNWGIGRVKANGMDNLPQETSDYLDYYADLDAAEGLAPRAAAPQAVGAGLRERVPESEYGYKVWDLGAGARGARSEKVPPADPWQIGSRTDLANTGTNAAVDFTSRPEDTAHYGTTLFENAVEGFNGSYGARFAQWVRGKVDDDGWRPTEEDSKQLVRDGFGDQLPYLMNANGSKDYARRLEQVKDQQELARLQTFESQIGTMSQMMLGSALDPLGMGMGAAVAAGFRVKSVAAALAATRTATPAARAAAVEAAVHGGFGRTLAEGVITDLTAESGFQMLESGEVDWHSVAVEVALGGGLAATTAGAALGAAGLSKALAPWMNESDIVARERLLAARAMNDALSLYTPSTVDVPIGPMLIPENVAAGTVQTINTDRIVTPWARLRTSWETNPGAYNTLIGSINTSNLGTADIGLSGPTAFSLEGSQAIIDRNTDKRNAKELAEIQTLNTRLAAEQNRAPQAQQALEAAQAAIDAHTARMNALRTKSGARPRAGSRARQEFDSLEADLENLQNVVLDAQAEVDQNRATVVRLERELKAYTHGPEADMVQGNSTNYITSPTDDRVNATHTAWSMMHTQPGVAFDMPKGTLENTKQRAVVAHSAGTLLSAAIDSNTKRIEEAQESLGSLTDPAVWQRTKDRIATMKLHNVWASLLAKRLRGQELLAMVSKDQKMRAHAWVNYGGGWVMSQGDIDVDLFGGTAVSTLDVGAGLTLRGQHVAIHETMHSLTSSALYMYDRNPARLPPEVRAAVEELHKLFDEYRAELRNRGISYAGDPGTHAGYAGKDIHEFIAQLFSTKEPVEILAAMPSKRGFASRLMDLADMILRILGMPSRMSAYNDAVAAITVMLESRVNIELDGSTVSGEFSYEGPRGAAPVATPRVSAGGQMITGKTKEHMDAADAFRDNVESRPEVKKIRARLDAFYDKFRGKLPEGFVNGWAKYMDSVGMNLSRSTNHYARWVSSWLTEVGNGVGRNGSTVAMRFERTMRDYRQKYVSQLNESLGTYLFGDYGTQSFSALQSGIYDQKKATEFWTGVQEYRLQRRHDLLADREHVPPADLHPAIRSAADAMDRAADEMAVMLEGAGLSEGRDIRTGTKAGTTGYIKYQFEAELLRQLTPAKQKAVADQLVEQYFKKYVAMDSSMQALREDPEQFTLVAHDKMNQRLEKLIEDAQAAEDSGDAQGAAARRNLASGLRKQIQALEADPEAFVAEQFSQLEQNARKMAEDHGRGYWGRIIQNHEVRADGTTAWAQELGKRIMEQDFAGETITPEVAALWKEKLQEQMQDRTRMELDLLTEFGDGQRLLDYIQLNGNAMISSQGRSAAGRSALAAFGIQNDADADAVLDGATQAGCSDDEIRSIKTMLDLYAGRLDADPETEALASFMSNLAFVTMMNKQVPQLLSDAGNAIQWAGMPAAVSLVAKALGNIASLKAFKRTYDPKTLETAEGQLYAFFPGSVGEQFNAFMPNVEKIIGDVQPEQGVATRVAANARNVAGHAFGSMVVAREMQLGMLKLAVQEVSASIITGKNWTAERMSVAGLTPEIVERIRKQFETHAPELTATGGREGKANWHLWDDNEALQLYQDAVTRVKGYMSLEENPGESPAWSVSSPLARIMLQFRGASLRSAEKLAGAEFGIQGVAATHTLGMQMLWAGALYTFRSLLGAAILGDDKAEKYLEERQKPSDINFQAWLNLIPMSGIASDVVGVGGVFFGQGGVAGVVAPAGPEALDRMLQLPGKAASGTLSGADIPVLNSPFIMGPAMQVINAVK